MMRIGLALGGGGARGFFHIGVLKGLEKLKIKISYIGGTSIGAVVGALYALYQDATHVEKIALDILEKYKKELAIFKNYTASSEVEERKLFLEKAYNFVKEFYLWNIKKIKFFLVSPSPFLKIFKELFDKKTFRDCKIPFLCSTVDLKKGEPLSLEEGTLFKAVLASLSLPGFFPPLRSKDKILVDGGVLLPLPVTFLKNRVDFIIGVNLEPEKIPPEEVKNIVEILFRVERIRYQKILENILKEVDYLISLKDASLKWTDFDKAKKLIDLGEKEVLDNQEKIIKILKKHFWRKIFLGR